MLKITLEVEGMHCGMCETHVNDVQGYGVGRIETVPYEKHGLFSHKK